jgi:hypothetical protein
MEIASPAERYTLSVHATQAPREDCVKGKVAYGEGRLNQARPLGVCRACVYSIARITSVSFWPPKPKLLDNATRTGRRRAWLGT